MRGETPNYVKNDFRLPQNVPKCIWKLRRSKVKMTGREGIMVHPVSYLWVVYSIGPYNNNPLFIDTMLIYNLTVLILLVSIACKSVDTLKVVTHIFLCKFCRKCKLQSMWVPPNWIVNFTVTEFKNEALLKRGISCLWGYAFQVLCALTLHADLSRSQINICRLLLKYVI